MGGRSEAGGHRRGRAGGLSWRIARARDAEKQRSTTRQARGRNAAGSFQARARDSGTRRGWSAGPGPPRLAEAWPRRGPEPRPRRRGRAKARAFPAPRLDAPRAAIAEERALRPCRRTDRGILNSDTLREMGGAGGYPLPRRRLARRGAARAAARTRASGQDDPVGPRGFQVTAYDQVSRGRDTRRTETAGPLRPSPPRRPGRPSPALNPRTVLHQVPAYTRPGSGIPISSWRAMPRDPYGPSVS